jgi:TolB-like protein
MRKVHLISFFILVFSANTFAKGDAKSAIYAQILATCQKLDAQIKAKNGGKKYSVALMDFQDNGQSLKDIEFGKGLADMIVSQYKTIAAVTVIDRKRMGNIMTELELSASGLVDETSTKQIGRILAADYIVSGGASQVGGNIEITMSAVEVETSEVVGAAPMTLPAAAVLPMAQAASLESKYPVTAAFRSMSVPGWGMFYNDSPGWGSTYTATTFGLLAVSIVYTVSAKLDKADYNAINNANYLEYDPDAKSVTDAVIRADEDLLGKEKLRNVFWICTGSVYTINIFHALFKAVSINNKIKANMAMNGRSKDSLAFTILPAKQGGVQMQATYSF